MGIFTRKVSIEPTELTAMRNEMSELWTRLDQTELAKAGLEDRLSSLTATTMVLSSTAQTDTAEIVEKIVMIESRLENNDAFDTKIDELHQRIIEVEQLQPAVDSYDISDITPKLAALAGRIEQVAELAAAPAQPDDELAARLDDLGRSAESVDSLNRQLTLLNARVSAQAEMADQLKALSDRISLLQQRSIDTDEVFQRIDAIAANPPYVAELSERMVELSSRLTAGEGQQRAVIEQTKRVEQRLANDQTKQQAEEMRVQLRAEIESLRADVATQIETASPDLDPIAGQIAQLAERVAANERDNRNAREELAAKVAAQEATAVDVASVHERLSASEHDARTARELTAALEEKIRRQIGEVAASVPSTTALDEQLAELRSRLDQQSGINDELAALNARVAELAELADQTNVNDQLAALNARIAELGELAERSRSTEPSDLPERLTALDERVNALGAHSAEIDRLRAQLEQIAATLPSTNTFSDQLADLTHRLGTAETVAHEARSQSTAVEQRVASASTELANQIGELSREIDTLASRETESSTVTIDDAVTATLRSGQVRLASEQARFEISFREDLAALAEQVRHLRGRS